MGGGSSLVTIDVSNITHDPTILAAQLQDGTTGIQPIDEHAAQDPASVAGFVRLTALLVGPTSGQWSGFGQEMLETMALSARGHFARRHDQPFRNGGSRFLRGDACDPQPQHGSCELIPPFSPPTVILDPQSGTLLEARNFDIPVLQSAAQDFVGSPSACPCTPRASATGSPPNG